MTANYYDVLLGFDGLHNGGTKLYDVKEVADFILTHDSGFITEADGNPLLEFSDRNICECHDLRFNQVLMAELRKGEGFEDRYQW